MVTEIDDTKFQQEVLRSGTPVLVDFYATWCGPCKMYSPVVERLATKYQGKVKMYKVDVDNANNTATKFNIASVPTTILFKSGKEVGRIPGAVSEATLENQIKGLLS